MGVYFPESFCSATAKESTIRSWLLLIALKFYDRDQVNHHAGTPLIVLVSSNL
jgi:hypothetical protein